MGFNSGFKGLMLNLECLHLSDIRTYFTHIQTHTARSFCANRPWGNCFNG